MLQPKYRAILRRGDRSTAGTATEVAIPYSPPDTLLLCQQIIDNCFTIIHGHDVRIAEVLRHDILETRHDKRARVENRLPDIVFGGLVPGLAQPSIYIISGSRSNPRQVWTD